MERNKKKLSQKVKWRKAVDRFKKKQLECDLCFIFRYNNYIPCSWYFVGLSLCTKKKYCSIKNFF